MKFLTVEEMATMLQVEPRDLLPLIDAGKIEAVRIGPHLRIPESELNQLISRCSARQGSGSPEMQSPISAPGSRTIETLNGKPFRVAGSLSTGFDLWPGQMKSPIRVPADFLPALLRRFGGQEIPVGGKFDDPGKNSLGEFIQSYLKIKMNPAVYIRALLVKEGFATVGRRRGYIRLSAGGKVPQTV